VLVGSKRGHARDIVEREIEIDSVDQVNVNMEGLKGDAEFEIAEVKP
jgi:hypothetical protein